MNILRKFQGRLGNPSRFNVLRLQNQATDSAGSYKLIDKNVAGRYRPLDENSQYHNQNTNTASRCYNSVDENYSRKRPRDSSDDDHYDAKRLRVNVPSLQYAIKKPSQYTNPMRKMLEKLFDPEITADGWERNNDVYKYHTKIRGKCFYQLGNSIDDARELVAETALKELCNLKCEKISWPEKLLPFRLDQHIADEIERLIYFNSCFFYKL